MLKRNHIVLPADNRGSQFNGAYLPQYLPDLTRLRCLSAKSKFREFSERTIRRLCKRIGSFVPPSAALNVAIASGMPAMHPYDRDLLFLRPVWRR